MILPGCNADEAFVIAERLRTAVAHRARCDRPDHGVGGRRDLPHARR